MTYTFRTTLELLGLDSDRLGQSLFDTDAVSVPPVVRLAGNYGIVWIEPKLMELRDGAFWAPRNVVWESTHAVQRSPSEMLGAFIRIHDAKDVLAFVKRYGPLKVCKHGLPATHNPLRFEHVGAKGAGRYKREPWCELVRLATWRALSKAERAAFAEWETDHAVTCYRETIADWMRYVHSAKALLSIGLAALSQRGLEQSDIQTLFREFLRQPETDLDYSLPPARVLVEYIVNEWITMGGVRPSLTWGPDTTRPSLDLSSNTFGQIGLQLAMTLTMTKQIVYCDSCKAPVWAGNRKPRTDRAYYCDPCKHNDPQLPDRERMRRYRKAHPNYDSEYRARKQRGRKGQGHEQARKQRRNRLSA